MPALLFSRDVPDLKVNRHDSPYLLMSFVFSSTRRREVLCVVAKWNGRGGLPRF